MTAPTGPAGPRPSGPAGPSPSGPSGPRPSSPEVPPRGYPGLALALAIGTAVFGVPAVLIVIGIVAVLS